MRIARFLTRSALKLAALPIAALVLIILAFAFQTRAKHPELRAWHTVELKEEFRAGRVAGFEEYLELEDRLFAELKSRVLDEATARDGFLLGKYHPGSPAAKRAWETPYNRSFELKTPNPKGAVLLVHGLSDSPYSMRAIADTFAAQGYYVVALRMPGHGTLPSGLLHVSWKDWYDAVTLAARYTAAKAPGKPFLAGGHSTGSALLTLYSLHTLDDPSLPRPSRLYLMSPAIGIDDFAVMTNVISALSPIPYFEKSAWLDVIPEYDPFKYNSFTVNAGNQIYHVTRELRAAFDRAGKAGKLGAMPRITVFHSLIDATVKTDDVVTNLLRHVPNERNELVLFDVNRQEGLQGMLAQAPITYLEKLRNATDVPFRMTLVANRDAATRDVVVYSRAAGVAQPTVEDVHLAWPVGVYSLGHVAIPFPSDDPVYGITPAADDKPPFPIGAFAARGESGALLVPPALLSRLRSNPFFDVIRAKVITTIAADAM